MTCFGYYKSPKKSTLTFLSFNIDFWLYSYSQWKRLMRPKFFFCFLPSWSRVAIPREYSNLLRRPTRRQHHKSLLALCVCVYYILGNIFNAHFGVHFASPHCLSRFFIPNFVHHHFGLKILQKLGYLLRFILISLIMNPKTQMFSRLFFVLFLLQWATLIDLSPKTF